MNPLAVIARLDLDARLSRCRPLPVYVGGAAFFAWSAFQAFITGIFMARTDAIVLGAGIVGVSVALHLAKRGLAVALVLLGVIKRSPRRLGAGARDPCGCTVQPGDLVW